jgi:hypothetical protein
MVQAGEGRPAPHILRKKGTDAVAQPSGEKKTKKALSKPMPLIAVAKE